MKKEPCGGVEALVRVCVRAGKRLRKRRALERPFVRWSLGAVTAIIPLALLGVSNVRVFQLFS